MASRIPIRGLVHRVKVFAKASADDGFGGIAPSGAATTVIASWKCRVTMFPEVDEQLPHGLDAGRTWKVIGLPVTTIDIGMFVQLIAPTHGRTPIKTSEVYRVHRVVNKIDDAGKHHHTSLVIELKDVDTTG